MPALATWVLAEQVGFDIIFESIRFRKREYGNSVAVDTDNSHGKPRVGMCARQHTFKD
jgi:hypothetical protein